MAPSGSLIPDDRSDRRKSGDSFDFSNLPPTPNEMTDDVEAETLRPYNLASRNRLQTQRSSPDLSLHSSASSPNSPPFSDSASISGDSTTSMLNNISPDQLALLHANLDARLQPFWSSILSGRVVRVSVFVSPHSDEPLTPKDIIDRAQLDTYGVKPEPIVVEDLITSPQGYFSHKFIIPFEKICTHPPSLSLAFGESTGEHHLVVRAELLPVEVPLEQSTSRGSLDEDGNPARRSGSPSSDSARGATGGGTLPHPSSQLNMMKPTSIVQMAVPLTSARVRLISDIDDTVKETQVLFGVKTIFRNTFVKSLEESVVEGMVSFFTSVVFLELIRRVTGRLVYLSLQKRRPVSLCGEHRMNYCASHVCSNQIHSQIRLLSCFRFFMSSLRLRASLQVSQPSASPVSVLTSYFRVGKAEVLWWKKSSTWALATGR